MHILFVCSGNTCRSPMAAHFAMSQVAELGLPWKVESAGLHAVEGHAISHGSANALIRRNIPLSDHKSKPLTAALVDAADVILTMTHSQAVELRRRFPAAREKVFELGRFAREDDADLPGHCDIVDPFGGSDDMYEACATELQRAVARVIQHHAKGNTQ